MSDATELNVLVFGDDNEWAVSEDDGCLLFHPNYKERPEVSATHIWREAFLFVHEQGGFSSVVEKLRAKALGLEAEID